MAEGCALFFCKAPDLFTFIDFKEAAVSGRGVLESVVICVAKSLSDRQVELNGLVKQLGGDFRWNFDAKVCSVSILLRSYC